MIEAETKYRVHCDGEGCCEHAWGYDSESWRDTPEEAARFATKGDCQTGPFVKFGGRHLCGKCAAKEQAIIDATVAKEFSEWATA